MFRDNDQGAGDDIGGREEKDDQVVADAKDWAAAMPAPLALAFEEAFVKYDAEIEHVEESLDTLRCRRLAICHLAGSGYQAMGSFGDLPTAFAAGLMSAIDGITSRPLHEPETPPAPTKPAPPVDPDEDDTQLAGGDVKPWAEWAKKVRKALVSRRVDPGVLEKVPPWTQWHAMGLKPSEAADKWVAEQQGPGGATGEPREEEEQRAEPPVQARMFRDTHQPEDLGVSWDMIKATFSRTRPHKPGEVAKVKAPLTFKGRHYVFVGLFARDEQLIGRLVELIPELNMKPEVAAHIKGDPGCYGGRTVVAPDGTRYVTGPEDADLLVVQPIPPKATKPQKKAS